MHKTGHVAVIMIAFAPWAWAGCSQTAPEPRQPARVLRPDQAKITLGKEVPAAPASNDPSPGETIDIVPETSPPAGDPAQSSPAAAAPGESAPDVGAAAPSTPAAEEAGANQPQ